MFLFNQIMFNFILRKIIGTRNQRMLKKMQPLVNEINEFEKKIQSLSDEQLKSKTEEFKSRLKEKDTLDDILVESFAVVREVAKRTVRMRHFDVQLIGGIALHRGMIAEMVTGEGKTLVATLSAYLNALTGKGVHIITVNDYLARRDREWMGPIYEFLGLTVGVIQHDMMPDERKKAYNSDIVYGTNNEFGFDYLRDNMAVHKKHMVQRELNYAILDEVDSILIDEARTPLIISGPAEESTDKYYKVDKIIAMLKKGYRNEMTKEETGDYIVDEKHHNAYLTEQGEEKSAKLLGVDSLHSLSTMDYKHHVNQALKAHELFKRDKDYMIKDGKVLIVDEFTGRLMPGRRWSDGLHQAIEAKENVKIERENQTLATITFQNFFKMYNKLAGMTGTAATEAEEFSKIYNLDVLVVPTNEPLIRKNYPDIIYKTEKEKFSALVENIDKLNKEGRPILVGTVSIEKSEVLSGLLNKKGIKHNVLNAKYHEREANIVAQAGRYKAVTIATNMAGRGTDILLGGNPEFLVKKNFKIEQKDIDEISKDDYEKLFNEVKKKTDEEHNEVVKLGGLHIIGTERHEARRIDNQLRGRAGRQGDPGSSQFFLSLEDDLLRIFGSDRIARVYDRLGIEEGQEIKHPLVTKAIETAQKRVENQNFQIRKQLLEYDNVMNRQREEIYKERKKILLKEKIDDHIKEIIDDVVNIGVETYINPEVDVHQWDFNGLSEYFKNKFYIDIEGILIKTGFDIKDNIPSFEKLIDLLYVELTNMYEDRKKSIGSDRMDYMSRVVMLHMIDSKWKDHLYAMDSLREGIGLRAYGQRDPLVEYQHEGYMMFTHMADKIKEDTSEILIKMKPAEERPIKGVFESVDMHQTHPEFESLTDRVREKKTGLDKAISHTQKNPSVFTQSGKEEGKPKPYRRKGRKIGRNDPCPCGSGKKYKNCCYPKYG